MKNQKKKRLNKKINKRKTYIRQVLETAEKINFAEILLKDLKPYLSTSNNYQKLEQLSNIIEEIQQDQIGCYMNTKIKLENMLKNATIAYEETHDNCYLSTITELKNVIKAAKHTYATIYDPK